MKGVVRCRCKFVSSEESAYDGYYKVIANPLLWFLQHSMWDIFRSPTIDRTTWQNWQNGYVVVNRLFAEAVTKQILAKQQPALVMLQDYHLYLAPYYIRRVFRPRKKYTLMHFIHIPWPGAEDWGFLPATHAPGHPGRVVFGGFAGFPNPRRWLEFHPHL